VPSVFPVSTGSFQIVDDHLQPVPPGTPGELILKGPGVMKEYYRNPEATAAAIVNGWLLTGDVARQDEEGFIWLVDRKKDVIITGGENIYPWKSRIFSWPIRRFRMWP
jgi:acyl-CoA synthetase (AMP-forming)/AMP-acid ligase II